MRITLVSQWFDPEVGSAAIPGSIVRSLSGRGHTVEVVTGFPNYPHGRLYDGYRVRPLAREMVRGVRVHRVALYPSHDRSAARRILNFLSFMVTSSTIGAVIARRSQVTLVYSTPGTVGMVGIVLRRLLGRPFVLYVQDVWPDTVTATGMLPGRLSKPAAWILHRFCNQVYRSAARIAVISPGMKDLLVARGVPAEKVEVIYNWIDEDVFRVVPGERRTDRFEVMYAGNIGEAQGLEVAVEAVAKLGPDSGVVLRLVGDGVAADRLASLASELGVADQVRFEGGRDLALMSETMASAHVQLVCLKDDPLFHITMPSKIQAILACGRPLLACAPGDAGALADRSGAGFAVPPGDPGALADAIAKARDLGEEALEEMGARGRAFYEGHLCASVGSARLERALSAAVSDGGRVDA